MSSQEDNDKNLDPAIELIREKVKSVYSEEPPAKQEAADAVDAPRARRSKHQDFMYKLSTSGKSLAQIQTEWHEYYLGLSENEKHEVWQEFYKEHGRNPIANRPKEEHEHNPPVSHNTQQAHQQKTVGQLKKQITKKASAGGKLKPKHHFQSLIFGLGMGSIVVLILLFSFFNERIIAPFITPSRKVSSTPIIIDQSTVAVDPQPKIIIPKINVEIPVVYDLSSIDEKAVQQSLEKGVLHYPTTPVPGEKGNAAFFGHSSNNIFNKGQYKFAFVLLRKLENGDIFYLTYNGKRYAYKVYDKKVVKPEEVSVLGPTDKPATATLITCDPPGTSINRLVVVGEQITPDPASNTVSQVNSQQLPKELPSNSVSLWQRIKNWLTN